MSNSSPITVAYGDGIGPEIMDACLHVIKEAGARIEIEVIERVLDQGIEVVKTETLRSFDGAAGYTLAQGQ